MDIDIRDIDIVRLRKDLIEHFTATIFCVSKAALVDLSKVENANVEEVVRIAIENHFNLNNYLK